MTRININPLPAMVKTIPTRSRVASIGNMGSGSTPRYTAVVLGAGGVGKSALVMRYGTNTFLEQYDPTIEEEYTLTVEVDDERTAFELIDTAGIEQFTQINENYIKRGTGFVLVFSLTQKASLNDLDLIRQQIAQIKSGEEDIPMVVVGTKMDLTGEREVSSEAIEVLAAQWKLPFYETSAKNGWHVHEVFNTLVTAMRNRHSDGQPKTRKRKRDQCVIM